MLTTYAGDASPARLFEPVAQTYCTLSTLTPSERKALARSLAGETYACLARDFGTPKAAEHATFRARKLAAALLRAA